MAGGSEMAKNGTSRRRRLAGSEMTSNARHRRGLDNDDSSVSSSDDVETGSDKGHRKRMYGSACSCGRFFLNPCLCLFVAARTCCASCCCHLQSPKIHDGTLSRIRRALQRKDKVLFWVVLACISCIILGYGVILNETTSIIGHPSRSRSDWALNRIPLQIQRLDFSQSDDIGGWLHPYSFVQRPKAFQIPSKIHDYDGLRFFSLEHEAKFERQVDPNDDLAYEFYRLQHLIGIDLDHMSERYRPDEDLGWSHCRRNNWMSLLFPTCNNFHEMDIGRPVLSPEAPDYNFDSYYFNHGYYRDAWMLKDEVRQEDLVLKMNRYKFKYGHHEIYRAQRDAIVMERLTSSPRIINMYGLCATSVAVETIAYEVEEYIIPGDGYMKREEAQDSKDVLPQNDYSATEKLEMALAMAESIADLHGFDGGVIVHDDVQPCQWLRTKDDKLVLGDFNRAEIMKWDESEQQYCKYTNGKGYGNYRAPEEFAAGDLDEKIDVFSMGNNIYVLLTGLWPFYENEDDGVVQKKVVDGLKPYIDNRYRTRSFAEGKLVEIMERMLEFEPEKRPDIFEVVRFLRDAVDMNKKQRSE